MVSVVQAGPGTLTGPEPQLCKDALDCTEVDVSVSSVSTSASSSNSLSSMLISLSNKVREDRQWRESLEGQLARFEAKLSEEKEERQGNLLDLQGFVRSEMEQLAARIEARVQTEADLFSKRSSRTEAAITSLAERVEQGLSRMVQPSAVAAGSPVATVAPAAAERSPREGLAATAATMTRQQQGRRVQPAPSSPVAQPAMPATPHTPLPKAAKPLQAATVAQVLSPAGKPHQPPRSADMGSSGSWKPGMAAGGRPMPASGRPTPGAPPPKRQASPPRFRVVPLQQAGAGSPRQPSCPQHLAEAARAARPREDRFIRLASNSPSGLRGVQHH